MKIHRNSSTNITHLFVYKAYYTESYIEDNADRINWNVVSRFCYVQNLSWEFILKFKEQWNWSVISRYHNLSSDFIIFFKDLLDWVVISSCQKLELKTVNACEEKICWQHLVFNNNIDVHLRVMWATKLGYGFTAIQR